MFVARIEGTLHTCTCTSIHFYFFSIQDYLRGQIKPSSQRELVDGIKQFWKMVDVGKCRRYIGHLRKVIPKVIEVEGAATGY